MLALQNQQKGLRPYFELEIDNKKGLRPSLYGK